MQMVYLFGDRMVRVDDWYRRLLVCGFESEFFAEPERCFYIAQATAIPRVYTHYLVSWRSRTVVLLYM